MKEEIHPKFYTNTLVTCACGNTFTTGSTVEKISVDICSNCHPFYTGSQKLIDTEGRVDRFTKRQAMAEKAQSEKKAKAEEKSRKSQARKPKSLKELQNMAIESNE